MARPGSVIGWTLDPAERATLLRDYPPRFANVVAHHVTLATEAEDQPLPAPVDAAIVGRADDGRGVEAMVVTIDSGTKRPDGAIFHVTWSLADGRRARESNDVIGKLGWTQFSEPIAIRLTPARI